MNTQLRNFGKTPAIDAKMRFCDPIIRDNPARPSFVCTEANAPISNNVIIGPDQDQVIRGPEVADDTFTSTSDESKFVYIFGSLTYRDTLSHDKQHLTRFCHRIVKQPPQTNLLVISISCLAPEWNCIDDDAPQQFPAH